MAKNNAKKTKTKVIKKGASKPSKIAPKKVKAKVAVSPKVREKMREIARKGERLISKGKERGFITFDEILREFPTVEDDIMFLDDLYVKLSAAGIDVLESGGMLDLEPPVKETGKKYCFKLSKVANSCLWIFSSCGQFIAMRSS